MMYHSQQQILSYKLFYLESQLMGKEPLHPMCDQHTLYYQTAHSSMFYKQNYRAE